LQPRDYCTMLEVGRLFLRIRIWRFPHSIVEE
jgi:hypothetical protein